MKLLKFILIGFLAGILPAAAQLRLDVEAPSTVDINEPYFQVRYSIKSDDVSDSDFPQFEGFEVLAGPSISRGRSTIVSNGVTHSESSSTYTFTLAPQKKGTFSLPPASVTVNGRVYKSRAVTIRVSGQGERKPGGTPGAGSSANPSLRSAGSRVSDKDLYVDAVLGKHEVYEQEGVLLTYKFYEKPGVGLNTVGLSQKPDFKGMVSQDIPVNAIDANVERVNGQTYRTGIVQQYLIFPQQAGRLRIPSLTFDCVVIQHDNSIDPLDAYFNGGGNIGVSLKREAAERFLEVKPLPQPKPVGFSGGVGQFTVKGELLTPNLRTNDMATYRITVSGSGNLKLLVAPALTFPSDFDTYSPKVTDQTEVTTEGVQGSIVFDYTFVPRNIGKYELPAFDFIYFDPQTEAYQTIHVAAKPVEVLKGTRSDADLERERQLRQSDIRDIHAGAQGLEAAGRVLWWGSWSYWTVNVFILLLGAGAYAFLRVYLRQLAVSGRRRKATGIVNRRLKMARQYLDKGEWLKFYTEVAGTLSGFLSDKLEIPLSSLNRDRVREELVRRAVPEEVCDALAGLQEECEYVRFAPSTVSAAAATEFYGKVVDVLNKLNESLSKKRK